MRLTETAARATLGLALEHRLIDKREVEDVLAAFSPSYPFADAMKLADTIHLHVKVDGVHALPHEAFAKAGAKVENQKDGYIKFSFPTGVNLIFSSINVSEDDLRETPETKRARPFLDHYGVDVRIETSEAHATFETIGGRAKKLGWAHVAQGGGGTRVFCCHTSVAAKHWAFPTETNGRRPPSIEIALGPLTIQAGKSGCDLRPTDPSLGLASVVCGSHASDSTATTTDASASYYARSDLGKFGEIGANRKPLADKFFAWYGAVFEEGALSVREKSLIALAVAHAVQCPYCIDAYSHDATSKGASLDQLTEAVHVAAAIRGGASLVHGVQMRGHVHHGH